MSVTAVENHLVKTTTDLFGKTLKAVDTLPGPLNIKVIKQMIRQAPAVYFVFLGGNNGTQPGSINARFDAFIFTAHASGQEARRLGDKSQIGAYQVLDRLLAKLHNNTVPEVGTLKLKRVSNLFSVSLSDDLGAALYAATFELQNMTFEGEDNLDDLADFVTFHAESSLSDDPKVPKTITDITLEQNT